MKFSKKFVVILALVAILAALLTTTVLAGGTKVVRLTSLTKVKTVSTQPAAFRVMGTYTCDKIQITSQVSGKTIYINVWDVKNKGNECNHNSRFDKTIQVGNLVPGAYTVLFNVDPETGKAQRKLKNVIAPMYATPTPVANPQ